MNNGWPILPLGDVLTERGEVPADADLTSGRVRIISKIGFNDGRIQLREGGETKTGMILVRPGDLVVSGINVAKGAIALYGEQESEPIAATIHYGAYIPDRSRAEPHFLWWLLRSNRFRETLTEYVPGGIKTELKAKRLLPVPVPLPPLPEQRRIVAKIDQLAAKIAEAGRLQATSASALNAIVQAETTRVFDGLRCEPMRRLAELGPDGVNPVQTGPFGAQLHKTEFVDAGVPVLNVGNVWPEGLELSHLDYVLPEKAVTLARYALAPNDLLFARSGATLGKVCLVPNECNGWLMTGHLFRVRLDERTCDPRYAFVALRGAKSVRDQIFHQVRGATRPGFNTSLLSRVQMPIPEIPEQLRIIAYLDDLQAKCDRLRTLQAQTAAELDALLPAILDRAFKGQL